jgi:hypothetical protein
VVGKMLAVMVIGATPWGGIAIPVGAGLAMGVSLPVSAAMASLGQFLGVLGVLALVRQAYRLPRMERLLARVQSPRLTGWMSRYGLWAVPPGVLLLGAYAVAATLSVLGVAWPRILVSIGLTLAGIGLSFSLALTPLLAP